PPTWRSRRSPPARQTGAATVRPDRAPLRVYDHYGPHGQDAGQFLDVLIVDRNAARRPIDISGVEYRHVGAVDSDMAALADIVAVVNRNLARIAHLFVAVAVDVVRIVESQEPLPAAAVMLFDYRVHALRRAAIAFPQLGPIAPISPE